jgi:hypothetical protein
VVREQGWTTLALSKCRRSWCTQDRTLRRVEAKDLRLAGCCRLGWANEQESKGWSFEVVFERFHQTGRD